MARFSENLALLPTIDAGALQLLTTSGALVATLENKPGTQGSVRVYAYVAEKWGGIGPEAAREALQLFAEHTEDARLNPGKHPNIDRLFRIVTENVHYSIRLV